MVLVTGVSGAVGRRVAELLATEGQALRMMARDPARAPRLDGAETVAGDYADPSSLVPVFAGVETAFIVSGYAPEGERARLHRNAIEAAAAAGVGRLVYLSFQGAAPTSKFSMARDHAMTEQYLQAAGVSYTALRDNLYLDILPHLFDGYGVARGPAGLGFAAYVSREDVARTAAACLTAAWSGERIFDVTGRESITLNEVAERLSVLTGRKLRYVDETVEEGRRWRVASGAPDWEVETWMGSYLATAAGELAVVSDTVERFTGKTPATLEEYFGARPALLNSLRGA
jgi:NAD(P)H dehydrogenase (quinone)